MQDAAAAEFLGNDISADQLVVDEVNFAVGICRNHFFQDKLFEVESEDQQGWRRPMAKKLDSIIGSDQWGRKKKSNNLGGKRKRGIVGFDLWGKRKRAQLNIEDDAEDIAQRHMELEQF